jgi:hypothetical protein
MPGFLVFTIDNNIDAKQSTRIDQMMSEYGKRRKRKGKIAGLKGCID